MVDLNPELAQGIHNGGPTSTHNEKLEIIRGYSAGKLQQHLLTFAATRLHLGGNAVQFLPGPDPIVMGRVDVTKFVSRHTFTHQLLKCIGRHADTHLSLDHLLSHPIQLPVGVDVSDHYGLGCSFPAVVIKIDNMMVDIRRRIRSLCDVDIYSL